MHIAARPEHIIAPGPFSCTPVHAVVVAAYATNMLSMVLRSSGGIRNILSIGMPEGGFSVLNGRCEVKLTYIAHRDA